MSKAGLIVRYSCAFGGREVKVYDGSFTVDGFSVSESDEDYYFRLQTALSMIFDAGKEAAQQNVRKAIGL